MSRLNSAGLMGRKGRRGTGARAGMARRLSGFALLPLLSVLGPFLLLPLIARISGVDGWAAIAVGQAVGGLGGLVGGLGWGLTGPHAVAVATDPDRKKLYDESLASRLLATGVAIPVCSAVAWVLSAPSQHWTAVLMAVSTATGALAPTWFSIGIGRPSAIAIYETIPRLLATGIASVLLIIFRAVWIYPVVLLVANVVGTLAYGKFMLGSRIIDIVRVRAGRALWSMRSSSASMIVGGSYTSTPVLIVGFVEPIAKLATYGSIDRLYRLGLIVVSVVTNALQAWVSESGSSRPGVFTRRMGLALLAHGVIGVVGCIGLAVLGPFVSALLFGNALRAEQSVSVVLGVTYLIVSLNSALARLTLIPWGGSRQVLLATVAGAVVGLAAMIVGGAILGTVGVATGFAASEAAVLIAQSVATIRLARAVDASTPDRQATSGWPFKRRGAAQSRVRALKTRREEGS